MEAEAPPPVRLWGDSGQEEMLRQREPPSGAPSPLPFPLTDFFDVPATLQILTSRSFRKFPDELLPYAPEVYRHLQSGLGSEVLLFVLGDTSYGACCVDEVAAQHLSADVIVHYGRTCLSPTSHLPVIYVFGRKPLDVAHLVQEFKQSFPLVDQHTQNIEFTCQEGGRVVVYYDVEFAYAAPLLEAELRSAGYPAAEVAVSRLDRFYVPARGLRLPPLTTTTGSGGGGCGSCDCRQPREQPDEPSATSAVAEAEAAEVVVYGRRIAAPGQGGGQDKKRDVVLFVGEEGPTLTNFVITYSQARMWRYSPDSRELRRETLSVNKTLMRRYFLVEKTKDADIIGIVAGTLGVSKYLQIMDHMKRLIKAAGKKYYTFVVGKLNPHKLANFEHIDIFVLVACPENSLIDSKEFFKPVITPYELELALTKGKEWTGEYITDFSEILPSLAPSSAEEGADVPHKNEEPSEEEDEPRLSLIDGKLKSSARPEASGGEAGQELVVSGGQALAVSVPTAATFLAQRQWKGLEQKLGETEVKLAEEGRAGIPKGYTVGEDSSRT
ncbi:diphthamide biosynthesis protein 2, putative [Acanthamoeba castellanii str. Neff]|uniref:2-(3-amino-3-carboxypropyl)histidine synthase subunit 2 n=1 Tax=Acanthamoeba castellanii (strain ATCC 30010 / Neff) TaxID=1257118 RepID=L8HJW9_ACACF|nr:diphthamide biosynthesis protein 2, putative [Acanthamoeba castellanii str. Neff]ELR25502.1 diphthamide biosynthesis protein 2, putative [Acanthamoeba castellanii str. Neff]